MTPLTNYDINFITRIDDTEDLDLVILMYNLLEYSSSYSDTTGSLQFSSKEETNNFNADNVNTNDF